MDHETTVTTTQDFLLLGCTSEQYSVNFSESLLSPDKKYTLHYAYPNKSTKSVTAEFVRKNQLLVNDPPEFDNPCTVDVEVCVNDSEQCLAKFSLDLVSPVEYLFRKYSLEDNEMSSNDKMTGALLAMSLSYYYVMEEQMKMERNADKILSTLLTCHGNTEPLKHITSLQSATYSGEIKEFAKYHHLQCTLQCLPEVSSIMDSPSKQPIVNGELKTATESLATNKPEEGHYVPLIKICKPDCGYQLKYTSRTTAANSNDYLLPTNHREQKAETNPSVYEIPNSCEQKNCEHTIPAVVQPYAVKKLEHSVSLGSILTHEYTYIEPEPPTVKPRPPRPPRPPPPKRKPAQSTMAPSSSRRSTQLERRKSAPLLPLTKPSIWNQWHKSKHHKL